MMAKLSLDADAMKESEELLVRVLHRALVGTFRTLAREGFVDRLIRAIETHSTPAAVAEAVVSAIAQMDVSPAEPPPPPPPQVVPELPPAFGRHMERPPEPPAPRPKRPKPSVQRRRSVADVCKTVGKRPEGFIDRAEATTIMGGPNHAGTLSTWILGHEVEALIVAGMKPPTKGLPGRLMVNRQSLEARNSRRLQHIEQMAG